MEIKRMTITRKVRLIPVFTDESDTRTGKELINDVYTYLREGMKNQNLAMNQYISALYCAMQIDASADDRKEMNRLYTRISESSKGSAYSTDIQFPVGLPVTSSLGQKVKQDFDNAMKKGLKYGRVSLNTYKSDNPLLVHVDYVRLRSSNPHKDNGLYHKYSCHEEFLDHLYKNDLEVFLKFAHNITFKVVFGNPHKSAELRSVFHKIFEEYYLVQGSSIEINNKNQIILNLSMSIPIDDNKDLDENKVVGIDLGIAIPAMCAVNDNSYSRKTIGNANDFLMVRTKIQRQRKRLQGNLKISKGGHGRKRKMQAMDRFSEYESNWVKTYNHFLSKNIVDFALKNNAKYINMEDLSGFGENDKKKFILRNWSYYQVQQMVEYKAKMHGIEVRYVNPAYTSQTCSCCGNLEPGQREKQAEFICKNPECENFGVKVNADFNAARNIAMSTEFITGESKKEKKRQSKITRKVGKDGKATAA